jgi:extracellular elastinolytic metalloproteinase
MRGLFTATLVVAGLAGRVCGHPRAAYDDGPIRRRKTLGFGPVHPHAVFHSSPYQIQTNGFVPLSATANPFDVAQSFIHDILGNQLSESTTFKIRKDSYTDKNTGVTHVYVRQVVNGLEVADGDMNINIKDGVVLSYGNSFYTGPAPTPFSNAPLEDVRHPHKEYCSDLENQLRERQNLFQQRLASQNGQVRMGSADLHEEVMEPVFHIHKSNCLFTDLPYDMAEAQLEEATDPYRALLQFMVAATPKSEVVQDILSNYDTYLSKMAATPTSSFAEDDMSTYISGVPDTVNPVKAKMAYIQVPSKDGKTTELNLVWKFEVEMEDNWYEAAVSATSPHRIISVVDWASDSSAHPKPATYNVFAWGINDPSDGGRSINKENYDPLASPVGWHAIPYSRDHPSEDGYKPNKEFWRNTTTTWGNNVFAHENWEGRNNWVSNGRPDAGESLNFDYPYDPKLTAKEDALAEAKKYINATVTQLFYTSNMVHDLFYRYGFDEVSGNFQQYNFGRGGAENDGVIANAQDGSGYNNANFMTPPDGQNGRCRMYLWNTALPFRDGDLEAGIVIHELSHGLSTRLTGGPANSGCLGWGESGGMGEGWGDFLATTIRSTSTYSDYPMGSWAANRERGIRNYPYSLDNDINPSTFKTLDRPGYWGVHAIGEVWAEFLWVVEQILIEKHGFSETLFPPTASEDGTVPVGDFYRPVEYTPSGAKKPLVPKHGNSLFVQLVINGMKLQKCRPTFFDARDSIIQADQILTGGENFCDIWRGFSKRGLGPDARLEGSTPWGGGVRANDFEVPLACQETQKPKKPKHIYA